MMGVGFTWVAILASLAMGFGGLCVFIWAVKKDYFKDIEDTKYQVFWSDLQDGSGRVEQESHEQATKRR
jgi:cbb3-type cytochrome oxidase maturation protein